MGYRRKKDKGTAASRSWEQEVEGQGYSSGKELGYRRRGRVQEGEGQGYSSGKELGYRKWG
jgi:hypothetical protein